MQFQAVKIETFVQNRMVNTELYFHCFSHADSPKTSNWLTRFNFASYKRAHTYHKRS